LAANLSVCCSSHALTSDVHISQTAQTAELFLSDGVIVTGAATGSAVNLTAFKGKSNAVVAAYTRVHRRNGSSKRTRMQPGRKK